LLPRARRRKFNFSGIWNRLKYFQKKKKKKRKCSDRVEGKCDAIFFQKNFGAKF